MGAHPAWKHGTEAEFPLAAPRAWPRVRPGPLSAEQLPSTQKVPSCLHENLWPRLQHLRLRGPGSSHPPYTCTQLVSESWPREVEEREHGHPLTCSSALCSPPPWPAHTSATPSQLPSAGAPPSPQAPPLQPVQAQLSHNFSFPLQRSPAVHRIDLHLSSGDTVWECVFLIV